MNAAKVGGEIYWDSGDRRGISPLELVRRASTEYPSHFRRAFALLDKLDKACFVQVANRVPPGWMSETAREFVVELTLYNLMKLREMA